MIDLDKALVSPAAVFRAPEDIVDEAALTHAQKCQALQQWAYDLRELMVATDENMAPEEDAGANAEQLSKVEALLERLGGGRDPAPTRQGGG